MRWNALYFLFIKEFYIMIANSNFRSIYTFWSSIFEEPIMLEGKILGNIERNEADIWDLSDIFNGYQVTREKIIDLYGIFDPNW